MADVLTELQDIITEIRSVRDFARAAARGYGPDPDTDVAIINARLSAVLKRLTADS